MFSIFKKKKSEEIFALVSGDLIKMEQVPDPTFSEKLMGDGYAILPSSGEIFSPITGKIESIFDTKHAITLTSTNGLEILIHMGLDTVELKGEPFEILVKAGQEVTQNTQLANVDLDSILNSNKSTEMMVVITNLDKFRDFNLSESKPVVAKECIAKVGLK